MHELAKKLHGREIDEEINSEEEAQAKKDGLIVIFGASDDLIEFRGAIHDEIGVCERGSMHLHSKGLMDNPVNIECERCRARAIQVQNKCVQVDYRWDEGGYSWLIHAEYNLQRGLPKVEYGTFDIMEDGEPYCRGIVISIHALPSVPEI